MYRRVRLQDDPKAKTFLNCLRLATGACRSLVHELLMGMSVSVPTAAKILALCQGLTLLTLCFSYYHIPVSSANPLLESFNGLNSLKSLSLGLTAVQENSLVHLPEFALFHKVSHLHLSYSGAAWRTIPLGFTELENLTHLSLSWSTSRTCSAALQEFLDKGSTQVVILWASNDILLSHIRWVLNNWYLVDRRLVLLNKGLYSSYLEDGGFWVYAERIVKWRANQKSKEIAHLLTVSMLIWTWVDFNLVNPSHLELPSLYNLWVQSGGSLTD